MYVANLTAKPVFHFFEVFGLIWNLYHLQMPLIDCIFEHPCHKQDLQFLWAVFIFCSCAVTGTGHMVPSSKVLWFMMCLGFPYQNFHSGSHQVSDFCILLIFHYCNVFPLLTKDVEAYMILTKFYSCNSHLLKGNFTSQICRSQLEMLYMG